MGFLTDRRGKTQHIHNKLYDNNESQKKRGALTHCYRKCYYPRVLIKNFIFFGPYAV